MGERGRARVACAAIFVLAFALRALVAWQYTHGHPLADRLPIDEAAYDAWARRVAAGDLVAERAFFQEPLYSYLLGAHYALFGRDLLAVRLVQSAIGALTAVLVVSLGRRLFGAPAGWIGGIAFALHRPALLLPSLLLKETLFLLVVAALALALIATREESDAVAGARAPARVDRGTARWCAVGALAGVAALLRGNFFVLGPILCAWPIARAAARERSLAAAARSSAAAALAWIATLAPAVAHNVHVAGVWLPTTGAGTNFAIGNALENRWGRPGELGFVRGVPETEEDDWRREAERRTGRALGPGEVSRYWLRATLASMRAEPAAHAAQLGRKLALALSSYEVPDNHHLEWDAQHVPALRWPLGGFGTWGVLALAAVLAWIGGRGRLARRPLESDGARRRAGAELARASAEAERADSSVNAEHARSPSVDTELARSSAGWRGWTLVEDRAAAGEIALLAALYLATIVLTMTSMRIRLGLVPLLWPFAGAFVVHAVALARAPRDGAAIARALVAALLAIGIVHAPIVDDTTREEDWLGRDFNLAITLEAEGEHRAAREIALALDRAKPGTSRVRTLLAQCEWDAAEEADRAGRPDEARELLLAGRARLEPALAPGAAPPRERYRAAALAGRIDFALGAWASAASNFAAAREFAPEDFDFALRELRARTRAVIAGPSTDAALTDLASRARALEPLARDARERGLLDVERATIHFELSRTLHDTTPERAAEAVALRQDALARLHRWAEDRTAPIEVRIEARLAAAQIQLHQSRPDSARNHAQAALALDPTHPRALQLLRAIESRR